MFRMFRVLEERAQTRAGLLTGRTPPTADIVGRRKSSGSRIIAQGKKGDDPQQPDLDFRKLSEELGQSDQAYYFAYRGCGGEVPANIRVCERSDALRWAESENGAPYRRVLLGN